jgi:putative transposase
MSNNEARENGRCRLDRIDCWTTEHHPSGLGGPPCGQARRTDATPLREIPARSVRTLVQEDAGPREATTRGVRDKNRSYVAAWMTGRAGIEVSARHMPHHDHEIELFGPATGRHLGADYLADQAARRPHQDLEAPQERER